MPPPHTHTHTRVHTPQKFSAVILLFKAAILEVACSLWESGDYCEGLERGNQGKTAFVSWLRLFIQGLHLQRVFVGGLQTSTGKLHDVC